MEGMHLMVHRIEAIAMRDRRQSTRYTSGLPTRIHTRDKHDRIGVTRNLSRGGALIATVSRFHIGERATLEFLFDLDPTDTVAVTGRVVRLQINPDATDTWQRFHCGIEFHEPLDADLLSVLLYPTPLP